MKLLPEGEMPCQVGWVYKTSVLRTPLPQDPKPERRGSRDCFPGLETTEQRNTTTADVVRDA